MTKQENKNSAKKKLIPAVAMLTTSAVMLSTSTYAWFTMSREVEVQNIQMTATTPEDIQISLGQIYKSDTEITDDEDFSLANSTGWLKADSDEMAIAPRADSDESDELDWSNIVDISKYYEFGKLIPASSTDGLNVFYTPDASGVGRTLTATAKFYQAAAGKTANKTGDNTPVSGSDDSAKATAHILTNEEIRGTGTTADSLWSANTTSGYKTATAWNGTNDDGYYIDIPVWLRTSSTENTNVYVSGYVTSQKGADITNDNDEDDLYKAVRVAILKINDSGEYVEDKGCLTLADGSDKYINPVTGQAEHSAKFPNNSNSPNILDSDNYKGRNNSAEKNKIYAVNNTTMSNNGNYLDVGHGEIAQNNATEAVATLDAGSGTEYGTSTKLIVRVWLEGEDGNCWNENAGQNWNIALKFSKTPLTAASGS